jgi:plastocyanin
MLFALMVSVLISAGKTATAQPSPMLNVVAGYGAAQVTVEEYFPRTFRVAEGTTVTWNQRALREHTVTFLAGQPKPEPDMPQPEDAAVRMKNPLAEYPTLPAGPYDGSYFINSGLMDQGETFAVTFAMTGTFPFVCLLRGHENMTGTVEVVPAGSPGITTQQQVDELIASEFAEFEAQVNEVFANRSQPASLENADGTRTWFVRNGSDFRDEEHRVRVNVRAYLPNPLTVAPGDTVVWYTDSRVAVHTITFPAQDQPPNPRWSPRTEDGDLVPLEALTPRGRYRGDPNSLAWPRIIEDPTLNRFTRPSSVYDPTRLFSSGPMGDGGPSIGRAFSLTFNAPGTFFYFCVPHVEIGQIGQITVE